MVWSSEHTLQKLPRAHVIYGLDLGDHQVSCRSEVPVWRWAEKHSCPDFRRARELVIRSRDQCSNFHLGLVLQITAVCSPRLGPSLDLHMQTQDRKRGKENTNGLRSDILQNLSTRLSWKESSGFFSTCRHLPRGLVRALKITDNWSIGSAAGLRSRFLVLAYSIVVLQETGTWVLVIFHLLACSDCFYLVPLGTPLDLSLPIWIVAIQLGSRPNQGVNY
ncbi:hypothetical protein BJ166DRAFT_227979 [Pestalotiopsis sp. NC0098]|nr:hypothetical protein BJ166DRAFT_227979 [Pestalotiopsis sp. NC0098]